MLGVVGDVVQDVVVWLEEDIRPATDTKSTISITRGGSAANVAAFAGPRHPTRFIGCVGDDLAGIVVTRELEGHGVDVRMQVAGETGTIVVLIDHSGERMMFPSRGASGLIGPIDSDWLDDVELLHLTGYSLQSEPSASSVIDATAQVKRQGGRISFDVSSTGMVDLFGLERFQRLMLDLAPDFVSANWDESHHLGLLDEHGEPGPFLSRLGDTVLLARAGTDPTHIYRAGELVASVPVRPAVVVRDLTGAGDAFNAGFLTSWLTDGDLVHACEEAHELARSVVAAPGATQG